MKVDTNAILSSSDHDNQVNILNVCFGLTKVLSLLVKFLNQLQWEWSYPWAWACFSLDCMDCKEHHTLVFSLGG